MHLGNIILQTLGNKGGWRKFSESFRHIIEFHHSDRPDLYELDGNKIRLTDKSYYNFGMVRHDLDDYYEIPPNTLYTNLIDDGIGIFHIGRKILIKIEPRRLVWFILKYGEVTPVYCIETIEGNEISKGSGNRNYYTKEL